MKMKKYIGLKLYKKPEVAIAGQTGFTLNLPDGCLGILFIFKTKKAGREWLGKDCEFIEVKEEVKNGQRTGKSKRSS